MELTAPIRGRIVNFARVPYAFDDAADGHRVEGITRLIQIIAEGADDERVQSVKFRADHMAVFENASETAQLGAEVGFNVIPGSGRKSDEHTFVSFQDDAVTKRALAAKVGATS